MQFLRTGRLQYHHNIRERPSYALHDNSNDLFMEVDHGPFLVDHKRINCGGPHWRDYDPDPAGTMTYPPAPGVRVTVWPRRNPADRQ